MRHEVFVPTLNNTVLMSMEGFDEILLNGTDAADVWMLLNLTAQVDNRTVTNEQYYTPVSLAYANLVDRTVKFLLNPELSSTSDPDPSAFVIRSV
ncbi:hypothetical protein AcV7_003783 [Taiwanofungus camphoratus]|nr:hypothetical protein AcV7_003783 [Antrodia cinnamomea]